MSAVHLFLFLKSFQFEELFRNKNKSSTVSFKKLRFFGASVFPLDCFDYCIQNRLIGNALLVINDLDIVFRLIATISVAERYRIWYLSIAKQCGRGMTFEVHNL